ncbi:hypothetical protein HMPREF0813_00673 [Streptococcus anginosus F0211]|uniref:Uncharacterized protein n=1 Tax=Streptococcus anginosus F0211 TaxID=706437 RepID=E6J0A3_STRAP|nr:hypothetical protein HMPREF0813_00673 [Streptococcus anginosus F0211]
MTVLTRIELQTKTLISSKTKALSGWTSRIGLYFLYLCRFRKRFFNI